MGAMSLGHWLVLLVIVLLVFGPKRLGDVGKGLGQGLKGLREGLSGKDQDGTPNAGTPNGEARPEKADSK
jgi:sec-independent protein translocase protein TatA